MAWVWGCSGWRLAGQNRWFFVVIKTVWAGSAVRPVGPGLASCWGRLGSAWPAESVCGSLAGRLGLGAGLGSGAVSQSGLGLL